MISRMSGRFIMIIIKIGMKNKIISCSLGQSAFVNYETHDFRDTVLGI